MIHLEADNLYKKNIFDIQYFILFDSSCATRGLQGHVSWGRIKSSPPQKKKCLNFKFIKKKNGGGGEFFLM